METHELQFPQPEIPMSDSEKLLMLANLFDVRYAKEGNTNNDVQSDLRRIAEKLKRYESDENKLLRKVNKKLKKLNFI